MRAVLDSSYVIHLVNQKRDTAHSERYIEGYEKMICAVSIAEIFGHARAESWSREMLDSLVDFLPMSFAPINSASRKLHVAFAGLNETWCGVRKNTFWRSHPIGHNDLWIAATAISSSALLVTSDEAQAKFGRLGGYAALWVRPKGNTELIA